MLGSHTRERTGFRLTNYLVAAAAIVVLLAAIISALKLPIYPDEVAYKIFLERFFLNGGFKQSVTPYCDGGFLQAPSLVLVPAASAWALVERLGIEWQSYRALPVIALCICIALLSLNSLRRGAGLPWPALLLIAIGPTIYGLTIFRPEIFLLSGGLMLFLSLRRLNTDLHTTKRVGFLILILITYSLLAFLHPKSLYLSPLLAIGVLVSSQRVHGLLSRTTYLLSMAVAISWISVSAINLHKVQFLECPEVPHIEQRMKVQAINLMSIFGDTEGFASNVAQLISRDLLDKTISQLTFKASYDVNYLPSGALVTYGESKLNELNLTIFAIALLSAALGPILCLRVVPWGENVLIASLSAAYLVPIALNLTRHWYEISFLAGAIMIINALYFPYFRLMANRSSATSFIWTIGTIAVLVAAFSTTYAIDRDFSGKFGMGYSGPGISIGVDRKLVKFSVDQLVVESKLSNEDSIVVDDLTYDALKHYKTVVPITYLGVLGGDAYALQIANRSLKGHGVRYGITRCAYFDEFRTAFDFRLINSIERTIPGERICLFSVGPIEAQP